MTSENQDALGKNISSAISSTKKLPFNLQINTEPKYYDQAEKMVNVFVNSFDDITYKFDFEQALADAKKYTTMAVVGTINKTVHQSQATCSAAADVVKKIIEETLQEAGISKPVELVADVINAFNNLANEKANPWFHIISSTSNQTVYQYSIFYVLQDESTGSVMLGSPVALEVSVGVDEHTLLHDITHRKTTYEIKVQGLTIIEPLE
ncbi:MAG: hypothetical protein F6J96_17665 [Symploca sp. SIO1C2]|nr:hypothetical protein [Symploca sp. SIO1C2]